MKRPIGVSIIIVVLGYIFNFTGSGCAQIGLPTGGPKDTLAPTLIASNPNNFITNFDGRTIRFSFDEYIEVKDAFTNVILNPTPKRNPTVTYNRSSVTVRLRDTLLENTTYSLNFGNAIVDFNEANILKDFNFVFSTGSQIDSANISGSVRLAESGLVDTTIFVYLYKDLEDSIVRSKKPDYITRVKGDGSFSFNHLPTTTFKVYALKDTDGGKTYNQRSEIFAFYDEAVTASYDPSIITLYAFEEEKFKEAGSSRTSKTEKEWKLQTNLNSGRLDLLETFLLDYTKPIVIDTSKYIQLLDSSKNSIAVKPTLDSTGSRILLSFDKTPAMEYTLIIPKDFASDTMGVSFSTDTLFFTTFSTKDYGDVRLRFANLELSKNPVVQFVQNKLVVHSAKITSTEWRDELFRPGTYDIRILYDDNQNGIWDPGNFSLKKQPEQAITLSLKLNVRASWEVDQEIVL